MGLFGATNLRIEVVDGIDIESGLTLGGDKVTVGTGAADSLRLGESDVVPAQLTFQRRGKDWEYFVSDRGRTVVSRGHPRAGRLKPGMAFQLGGAARIVVKKASGPAPAEPGKTPAKAEVPIALALPVLGLIVVGAYVGMTALRDAPPPAPLLATTRWFAQAEPLDPAMDACLAAAAGMDAAPVARTAPDWAFRAWLRAADKTAPEAVAARAQMLAEVQDAITRAHFLHEAGGAAEASDLYRRLENVMPLGTRDCPILAATRRDLAVLEMMGRNRN